ncbi:MAG: hypothetical protein WDM78_04650 [Puia sp.]
MNALLNTHLPVKPPSVNPFHTIRLLAYGGSVILVTAVTLMIYQGFQRSKKQMPETGHAKKVIRNVDSARTAILPGVETGIIQKMIPDSLYQSKREDIILSDSQVSVVSGDNHSDSIVRKETRSTTNRLAHRSLSEGESTVSPAVALAKAGQPSAVIDHRSASIAKESHDIPVKNKTPYDLTIFLSEQQVSRMESEWQKHVSWISKNTSNKKDMAKGMKLSDGKNVANKKFDGSSYLRFGFGLSLVQYYTSNPDQTFQLNYIPGLTGQYVLNNHWAFGMNIFPYQKIPFSDRDSIYTSFGRDSGISPNNSFTKKYYLNN